MLSSKQIIMLTIFSADVHVHVDYTTRSTRSQVQISYIIDLYIKQGFSHLYLYLMDRKTFYKGYCVEVRFGDHCEPIFRIQNVFCDIRFTCSSLVSHHTHVS